MNKPSNKPEPAGQPSDSSLSKAQLSGTSQKLDALLQHPALWRASQTPPARNGGATNVLGTGFRQLDALLHAGGWPRGNVVECLSPLVKTPAQLQGVGQGALQLFLPALRQCAALNKPILLVAPPHIPYLPGWQLNTAGQTAMPALWVVTPPDTTGLLWAAEQILQSNSTSAVFIWLAQQPAQSQHSRRQTQKQRSSYLRSTALRKLQVAARRSESLVVVFRDASALQQPSPAPLRLVVSPVAGKQATQLEVHIAKQPGGWGGQRTRINWHSRLQRPVIPATRWPVHQPAQHAPLGDSVSHDEQEFTLLGMRASKWS